MKPVYTSECLPLFRTCFSCGRLYPVAYRHLLPCVRLNPSNTGDRSSRTVPSLSRRHVPAYYFVLPSSCLTFCLNEFGSKSTPSPSATFFFYNQQEWPSDTSFFRVLQLAAKGFFIVLLYRMSLSHFDGISTRRFSAASPSKCCVLFQFGNLAVKTSTSGCFFIRVLGGSSFSESTGFA